MVVIVVSPPYVTEDALGGLYIALASADAGIPTDVYFMGDGCACCFESLSNPLPSEPIPYIEAIKSMIGLVKLSVILDSTLVGETQRVVRGVLRCNFSELFDRLLQPATQVVTL